MECKFKVGDKVKLVRKVAEQEGWLDIWVETMDEVFESRQGKTLVITEVDGTGVFFKGSMFSYPSDAFELVEACVSAEDVKDALQLVIESLTRLRDDLWEDDMVSAYASRNLENLNKVHLFLETL